MIARQVVPQFGFAITMAGRDFGSGREEELMGEFLGLETSYCIITSLFFRHDGMERACISTVHLHD